MIVFYNKTNGEIVGTIDGRVHGPGHLNMWIGQPDETDRIVCQWRQIEGADGSLEYQPEIQPEVFAAIDQNRQELDRYRVDTATQKLVVK